MQPEVSREITVTPPLKYALLKEYTLSSLIINFFTFGRLCLRHRRSMFTLITYIAIFQYWLALAGGPVNSS